MVTSSRDPSSALAVSARLTEDTRHARTNTPTASTPQRLAAGEPGAENRSAILAAYRALGYSRPPKASRPSIRGRALTLERAVQESPLSQLSALARESQRRLQSLQRVLPPLLWAQLSAGPIEADAWCVLVSNNAVAAKIRQWVPAMAAHLRTQGWPVQTIRVKVRTPSGTTPHSSAR